MNDHKKRIIRKIISPFRRVFLKNKDFSILSNNCWGGIIYDIYGMKYTTPTIGLYFSSKDYIKFLKNISHYLSCDLIEENISNHLVCNCKIVGKLDDINIYFLHYKSFEEAKSKWNKRKQRLNFSDLLVKFSDQNGFKYEDFEEFDKLNFKNKIFVTTNQNIKSNNMTKIIYLADKTNSGFAVDDIKPSLRKINIIKLLDNIEKE